METPGLDAAAFAPGSTLSDEDIVKRVRFGEPALFEILMRRHNRRIYRTARAVLTDENDVEDVMQQAYVNAFTHLHQFEERSQFSTWLTRIGEAATGAFQFQAPRCDRVVAAVLARIGRL